MNAIEHALPDSDVSPRATVVRAAQAAADRLAPYWPLQNFVAVNPMMGIADADFVEAGLVLARIHGARSTLPRAQQAAAVRAGRIEDEDLSWAIADLGADVPPDLDAEDVRARLDQEETDPASFRLPTALTVAAAVTGIDWPRLVVDHVSRWAATRFDRGAATWAGSGPDDAWRAWKTEMCVDRSFELLGLHDSRARVEALPDDPDEVLERVADRVRISEPALADYFHRLLADVAGWAGLARQQGWVRELRGEGASAARDLLVIRAACELLVLDCLADPHVDRDWDASRLRLLEDDGARWRLCRGVDHVLHRARERAVQRAWARTLEHVPVELAASRAQAQLVFCIDVRSERMRRALELGGDAIETFGFAGFFGLPIELEHGAAGSVSARCPVLLEPGMDAQLSCEGHGAAPRPVAGALEALRRSVVGCFAHVEALGLVYGAKLLRDTLGLTPAVDRVDATAPLRIALEGDARVDAAAGMLGGIGLTKDFARLVVFAGHGASTVNNPYASGLDCGACGGHAGDVNARAAAQLLNDPHVREGLAARGIHIPEDTHFMAALHDTTSDDIRFLDLETLPPELAGDLAALVGRCGEAARRVRAERAPTLGLQTGGGVDSVVRGRTRDWSQVRPEWGLAGCSAFIAAPRARTRGIDLEGRSFLHSYDWRADDGFGVLELILTAPMVVASWISLQYFASTVDNAAFGSGDKTLHNVVGGVGVLEGNGGDLRVGLPRQSVDDGRGPVHEPVRLNAFIAAPPEAMNGIIARHDGLRTLVDRGWIQLHALDDAGRVAHRYLGDLAWTDAPASTLDEERAA